LELRVDLEPDDRLVASGSRSRFGLRRRFRSGPRRAHVLSPPFAIGGTPSGSPLFFSQVLATRSSVPSSKGFPTSWRPMGRPERVLPEGKDSAGAPASEAGIEKMSFRYIASGSSTFSPSLKGGVGVVGRRSASARVSA